MRAARLALLTPVLLLMLTPPVIPPPPLRTQLKPR
jgi:hypothetical protein